MQKTIQQEIETCTQIAWNTWASQHPNLSQFINQIEIQNRIAENIRISEEFKLALENYYNSNSKQIFAAELSDLALTIISKFI